MSIAARTQIQLTNSGAHRARTKLLVIDAVIGARNEHDFAKILDIQMLVHFRGKERTQAEWKELLHAAGFELTRVVPTSPFVHVMEAVRIK